MTRQWDEVRQDLEHVIFVRGICRVAEDMPADRSTVYRMVRGQTKRPSLAVQRAAERVIDEFEGTDEAKEHPRP